MNRILFLLLTLSTLSLASQTPYLEADLVPGPYAVGFQVVHEYDHSRTRISEVGVAGDSLRTPRDFPVQISIWYPAAGGGQALKMPLRRYLDLMATEYDFSYVGDPQTHPFLRARLYQDVFFIKEQIDLALNTSTQAIEQAAPAAGKFPLLVYSPGAFGPGFENATLFEYLASHGYVVASYPSPQDVQLGFIKGHPQEEIIDVHTRSLEYVIAYMHRFPAADPERLGLFGFSAGATASAVVQARNRKVKAVAYMDGPDSPDALLNLAPFLHLDQLKVPYLLMFSGKRDHSRPLLIDILKQTDAYMFEFPPFGHCFFGSAWILLTNHQAEDSVAVRGTQEEINQGYTLLGESILQFFDNYLQQKPEQISQLKQFQQKAAHHPGLVELTIR